MTLPEKLKKFIEFIAPEKPSFGLLNEWKFIKYPLLIAGFIGFMVSSLPPERYQGLFWSANNSNSQIIYQEGTKATINPTGHRYPQFQLTMFFEPNIECQDLYMKSLKEGPSANEQIILNLDKFFGDFGVDDSSIFFQFNHSPKFTFGFTYKEFGNDGKTLNDRAEILSSTLCEPNPFATPQKTLIDNFKLDNGTEISLFEGPNLVYGQGNSKHTFNWYPGYEIEVNLGENEECINLSNKFGEEEAIDQILSKNIEAVRSADSMYSGFDYFGFPSHKMKNFRYTSTGPDKDELIEQAQKISEEICYFPSTK